MAVEDRERLRLKRHKRLRYKVIGSLARPRLNVSRSLQHIYAQIIDDATGHTICAASSRDSGVLGENKNGGNVAAAAAVGKLIAQRSIEKGIEAIVFDRGGYKYHGRVKAVAEAAREGGLKF